MTLKQRIAGLTGVITGVFTITLLVFGSVSAIGEGQIEAGDIYRIKNLTKNSAFASTQTADKCDDLLYKIRLHNPGPGVVNNVNVRVTLPSASAAVHPTTATITSQNAQPAVITANATLSLSSVEAISYVNGSTQLLDTNSTVIGALPDGITAGGVNIGEIGVSILQIKFIQFKVKVGCPTPPPPESKGVCKELSLTVTDKKRREVRASVTGETVNATITAYRITFGDGTSVNEQSASHRYAQDGTYAVTGYVTVRYANNTTEEKTSKSCMSEVTFKKDKPPVVPPSVPPSTPPVPPATPVVSPTALPETGAGGMVAIFSSVTSVSSLVYYLFSRRNIG